MSLRRRGFDRKEKNIVLLRSSPRALVVAAIAAVLDMYLPRRAARAVRSYRRRSTPRPRHRDGNPVSSAPTAGRVDRTGAGDANAVGPGASRETDAPDRSLAQPHPWGSCP